jgi:hypothetical protein
MPHHRLLLIAGCLLLSTQRMRGLRLVPLRCWTFRLRRDGHTAQAFPPNHEWQLVLRSAAPWRGDVAGLDAA